MFLRIRWFVLGVAVAVGSGAWVISKAVRLRQRLSPSNLRHAGAMAAAELFSGLARLADPQSRERTPH